MGVLAEIVLPIFAVVALGFAAAARGLVSDDGLRALNDFVFWVATPALLFGAVSAASLADTTRLAVAYFSAAFVLFGGALLLSRLALGATLAEAGVFALGCTFGNVVMMGVPLVAAAFGTEGLAVLLALVALHSGLLLPAATIVVEIGQNRGVRPLVMARQTIRSLIRNPIIVSIVAALAWRLLDTPVPGALRRLLELLGSGAPALALFCLGGSLAGFRVAGELGQAAIAGVLKLLVLPLLVAASAWAFGLTGVAFAVAVATAALPTGANAFMLARRYGTLTARSAGTVVLTTVVGLGSMSLVLAMLRQ